MRIVPTPEEKAREDVYVEVFDTQTTRRWGARARQDIPANTMLMVYPGTVTRPPDTPRNTDYTWGFFKVNRTTGEIDTEYDITANAPAKNRRPPYAAPVINEPPPGHRGS